MTHRHVLETFRLDGRIALVTGGARGLGRSMALALAEAGADVALAGRTVGPLEETAAEIGTATGRRVRAVPADVTRADDVARLVSQVEADLGPIDILINNAGSNIRGTATEISEADWDAVVEANLKGPFLCARAVGPGMATRGWGRIINIGSILSMVAIPGRAPYASAKAGVTSLTRVLALEWGAQGVTVNAICPGPIATELNRPLLADPQRHAEFVRNLPVGRLGEPDEVAGLAVLLASDASSFITGASIYADGGWTAR